MQVELFKRNVKYVKDGEEKTATNFFVKLGDVLVPIEVKYFENKETGDDKNYRTRKTLMSAFAGELPEKTGEDSTPSVPQENGKPKLVENA